MLLYKLLTLKMMNPYE